MSNPTVKTSVSLVPWCMSSAFLCFSDHLSHHSSAQASAHPFKLISLSHLTQLLLETGHLLGLCRVPQYVHFLWGVFVSFYISCVLILPKAFFTTLASLHFLVSLFASSDVFCSHCSSTLFVQQSIAHFDFVYLITVSSPIISVIILLSRVPVMNCS